MPAYVARAGSTSAAVSWVTDAIVIAIAPAVLDRAPCSRENISSISYPGSGLGDPWQPEAAP
jgi:hypothetical protein